MSIEKVIYVHKPEDVPACEHWAIIEGTSVFVPGDERSRTNPGHGYPEHTDNYITYTAYLDEAEFKRVLAQRLETAATKYHYTAGIIRGIHVQGVYEHKVKIELTEK